MNQNIKSIIVLILLGWVLFGTISLITVRNPYEFIIPFVLLLLPFLLLLFYFSFSLKANSVGWEKIIALIGIYIGIVSVFVCTIVFIWDLIR